MAIDKLSINDLLIDNIQGVPPPEYAPHENLENLSSLISPVPLIQQRERLRDRK
jgi:hypothetical protein